MVRGASPVRDLAGLRGRLVATSRGSVGHYLVLRALAAAKLPADSVRYSFLSPGDAKAAFSSGAVDAWATWTPYLPAALKEGARVIVDGADLARGSAFDVANDRAIATKPALIADFLKREGRALAWARANPDAYAAVLARETGLPPDIARAFAVKNARDELPIDAAIIREQQTVLDTFRAAHAIEGGRPLADAFVTDLPARAATAD
ncbi:MAG: ABC transporter substrate-binding protein [Sphingomonas sp.]